MRALVSQGVCLAVNKASRENPSSRPHLQVGAIDLIEIFDSLLPELETNQ